MYIYMYIYKYVCICIYIYMYIYVYIYIYNPIKSQHVITLVSGSASRKSPMLNNRLSIDYPYTNHI